jgi:hypothetical protein
VNVSDGLVSHEVLHPKTRGAKLTLGGGVRGCIACLSGLRGSTVISKPYSSKLRTLACTRQRLNRLSIRSYVLRVIARVQEAKTLTVLPFIMPPRERTMGWKGRLLVGRWRTLWSETESRHLLTSRDGSVS